MSGHGLVLAVDQVSAKQGESVWQIITDAQDRSADGLNRCAVWVSRPGPTPAIGEAVTWDERHVWWGNPEVRARKVDHEFDPSDPRLYAG